MATIRATLLLSDFGIAKLQGMRGLTKSGTTIGTPEYMSPEQAEGKEIDPRADVYSLGCVLYEALSGRPPFIGATPVSVLYQQVHSRPAYLRGFNADVPRELSRLLDQALAKRPEERFATAARFAEALLPFAEGALPPLDLPQEARESSAPEIYGPHEVVPSRLSAPDVEPLPPGLGAEGLDAIFPDGSQFTGGRRVVHSRPLVGGELIEASEAWSNEVSAFSRQQERRSIPLNAFSLPTKETRKLNLPLTADGQLDMDTLLASIDGAPTQAQNRRTSSARLSSPLLASPRPSRPLSEPVWRPPLPDTSQKLRAATRPRVAGRPLWAGVSVAAMLVVSLAVWIAVSASSHGVTAHSPTATPAIATHTSIPATKTPAPTTTPTVSQQQLLDQKAAASFRAITLGTFRDTSCSQGNAVTHFSAGSSVYVNFCTSDAALNVPTYVYIRQNSRVIYTMASDYTMVAHAHYWFSRNGVGAGSYDLQVIQRINGQDATAADIAFTVG